MQTREAAAVELLRRATRDLRNVEVLRGASSADLTLVVGDQRYVLELRSWGQEAAPDTGVVWITRNASSEIHDRLRRTGQHFIDLAGVVHLSLPAFVLDRTHLEPVRIRPNETRNPFSDRSSMIARVLFDGFRTGETPTVQELAGQAGLPLSTTSYAVRALEERELVTIERKGRSKHIALTSPEALIEQWTLSYNWRNNEAVAFHAPIGDMDRFLDRLPDQLGDLERWALTLQAGASRVVRHAAWDAVHIYVKGVGGSDLTHVGRSLGWEPSRGGKVVLLWPYYRESLWVNQQKLDRLPVVSDLQLILDLWHYPVRGREQAARILDRYVGT
jgi:hypothetical protein